MPYSKKSRIANLEGQRSSLESELRFIGDNIVYFESTQAKYDAQIDSFNNKSLKSEFDMKEQSFIKCSHDDFAERIRTLYSLKDNKLKRVDEINVELKRLY